MKIAAAAVAFALLAVARAGAVLYTPWPSSVQPAFLSADTVRFDSNLATRDLSGSPYVVSLDGTGLRPADADEAAAPALPSGRFTFSRPASRATTLYAIDQAGRSRLVDPGADAESSAAVSPDGRVVVFGEWVGFTYADGSALYAAPTDGSAEPVRLTPTPCTVGSATHSALQGRCFDGTDGPDRIVGTKGGDVIITGSGDDVIRAGDGQNEIQAQWGNDLITGGTGPDQIWAGDGDDVIRTGAGSDLVIPGRGHDVVVTGRGADHVYANDGQRDVIDCGPGLDGVIADRTDVLRHCEHVFYDSAFLGWPPPR